MNGKPKAKRKSRAGDNKALLYAYGPKQHFLTTEEAVLTDCENRIRSIWPFITREVFKFQARLKPMERVNFDEEDTVIELWVLLRENDEGWTPERGKYITYAGTLIERELQNIRDRSRTVQAPKNSGCRMKEYDTEEAEGRLTDRRRRTADDIRRTASIASGSGGPNDLLSEWLVSEASEQCSLCDQEDQDKARKAVGQAIMCCLTPDEAMVMGRSAGLWRQEAQSDWRIGFDTLRDAADIRKIRMRAFRKIKDYLSEIGFVLAANTTE